MTKQSKEIKKGMLVYNHPQKKQGKILYIKGEIVGTEVIVSKEGKLRTTTTEDWNIKDVSPLRKSKSVTKKYNPNEMFYMVNEFHKAFNHPVAKSPSHLELERGIDRAVWTGEEALVEFIHQSSDNEEEFLAAYDTLIQGLEKAKEKSLAMEYNKTDTDKLIGQADAIIDALYFLFGSLVEMGIKPFNLFKIVQDANMAKLHADGKPRYREGDGKIIKPEGWQPPEGKLEAEIERQMKL